MTALHIHRKTHHVELQGNLRGHDALQQGHGLATLRQQGLYRGEHPQVITKETGRHGKQREAFQFTSGAIDQAKTVGGGWKTFATQSLLPGALQQGCQRRK
ncbi:hypothetical protein D3C73_883330 [compost metagenome]